MTSNTTAGPGWPSDGGGALGSFYSAIAGPRAACLSWTHATEDPSTSAAVQFPVTTTKGGDMVFLDVVSTSSRQTADVVVVQSYLRYMLPVEAVVASEEGMVETQGGGGEGSFLLPRGALMRHRQAKLANVHPPRALHLSLPSPPPCTPGYLLG